MAILSVAISGAGNSTMHVRNSDLTTIADGTYFYNDTFVIGANSYTLSIDSQALVTVGGCPFPPPGSMINVQFGDASTSLQNIGVQIEDCVANLDAFTSTTPLIGNTVLSDGTIMTVAATSTTAVTDFMGDIQTRDDNTGNGNVSLDFNAFVTSVTARIESINGFSEHVIITPAVPAANVVADTGITYDELTGRLENTDPLFTADNTHGAVITWDNVNSIDIDHHSTEVPPDADTFRFTNLEVETGANSEPVLSGLVANGSVDGSGSWTASVNSSISAEVFAVIMPAGSPKQDPCDIIMQSVGIPAGSDIGIAPSFSGTVAAGSYELQVTPNDICSQVVTCEPFTVDIPTVVPVWTTTGAITNDGSGPIVFVCKLDNAISVTSITQTGAPSGTILTQDPLNPECVQVNIPQQADDFSFSLFANGDGFNVEKPVTVDITGTPTGQITLVCDPASATVSLQGTLVTPTITATDQFGNPIAATFDSSAVNLNQVGDYIAVVSATANGETVTKNFPVTVFAQLYYGCTIPVGKDEQCKTAVNYCFFEEEIQDFVFDWTGYLDGNTIVTSTWLAVDGGATIAIEQINGNMTGIRLSDGVPLDPGTYTFVNTVESSLGRRKKAILELQVLPCP